MATDKLSTEPYKGVRDFYPEDQAFLTHFLATCRTFCEKVGYVEYEASILEPAELYRAKGAENEEMVNEQTYTFTDRGDRQVTLRPEMTPTVARMVAGRRRELAFPLRWYSIPNCFRYERPQRGRLREFWQLNVDIFGSRSPMADAEMISMAYGLMSAFGATEKDFVIKVGSRTYIDEVAQKSDLNDEQKKKLLALLDRKAKISADEFDTGLLELGVDKQTLSPEQVPTDIAGMIEDFRSANITNIEYDPSVVRGFAYYTGIVFEVFDTDPGNNRALMGGGRYDNLTQLFDDEPLPGVGFAMGDETMRLFLESRNLTPPYVPPTRLYVAVTGPELALAAQTFAGELRTQGVNVAIDFGEKKLAEQIKTAVKHQIPYLIVLGPDELTSGRLRLRDLATGEERELGRDEIAKHLQSGLRPPASGL